jgi:tetratricopeptide (TPR) repeat protein
VLERSPKNLEALVLLANIQAAEMDFEDAEETLRIALEVDPKYRDALLSLAGIRMANQQLPEAEALLRQVIANAPSSPDGYLRLAGFLTVTGRAAEAEPLLVTAVEQSANSVDLLKIQLDYYTGLQKLVEAEAVARKIYSLYGSQENYWTVMADFYLLRNEWDKARVELERLLQEHKNALVIRRKLVEVHLALKNDAKAEEINEGILRENSRDALAHLAKGRMLFGKGDSTNALLELNQTKQFQPDLPALHFWYGVIYSRRGEMEQAKQALAEALKYDANYLPARLILAELQNRTGAPDAALLNVQEVLKRNPRELQAYLLMSPAYIVKKDFAQAEKLLKAIVARAPGNDQGRWQLGLLEMQKGNYAAGRELLEGVWNTAPQAEPALMATVMSYLLEKEPNQAVDFLEQQIASHPELSASLYHMRGEVNRLQNRPDAAIQDYNKALAGNPAASGTAIALANLYAEKGQLEQAIRLIRDAQQCNPQDHNLPLVAGWFFERSQRWQDAQKSYEQALTLRSDNPVILNNLAWIMAEHGGNIDVALKYAQQAKELQSDNANITNTIGWIYYKKNSYQLAYQYLQEAVAKAPTDPLYQYQLGMASVKLGRTAEARQALEKALRLDPKFPQAADARKALAEL